MGKVNNSHKKLVLSIIILLSIGSMAFTFTRKELSKEDIINIAVKRAIELGFSKEETTVFYDEGNKRLKENAKNIGVSTYNEKTGIWEKDPQTTPEKRYPYLVDRNYQAIYFVPKKMQLGGDLWVFIDKNSGEVISYVFGK